MRQSFERTSYLLRPPEPGMWGTIQPLNCTTLTCGPMSSHSSISPARRIFKPNCFTTIEIMWRRTRSGRLGCKRISRDYSLSGVVTIHPSTSRSQRRIGKTCPRRRCMSLMAGILHWTRKPMRSRRSFETSWLNKRQQYRLFEFTVGSPLALCEPLASLPRSKHGPLLVEAAPTGMIIDSRAQRVACQYRFQVLDEIHQMRERSYAHLPHHSASMRLHSDFR